MLQTALKLSNGKASIHKCIFTVQQHRFIEKNWHKNYNNFNLSQNLHFSTDVKANREACRRTCGDSNDTNRIKIPGGALGYLGGRIRSLSKLKNTPKALISGQKSTLILIKNADFFH